MGVGDLMGCHAGVGEAEPARGCILGLFAILVPAPGVSLVILRPIGKRRDRSIR
jgi:hypothetical protein